MSKSAIEELAEFLCGHDQDPFHWIAFYLAFGFSWIPVRYGEKIPLGSWKPFQNAPPTEEQAADWVRNYDRFNFGVMCGYGSLYGSHCVVDCDHKPPLSEFPSEFRETWITETPRGYHFHFYFPDPLRSRSFSYMGGKYEFKGVGQYAVEPPSVVGGYQYRWVEGRGFSCYSPLPSGVVTALSQTDMQANTALSQTDMQANTALSVHARRPCVHFLLQWDIPPGKRNEGLHLLYSLLLASSHTPAFAGVVIRRKNSMLSSPLPASEIAAIISPQRPRYVFSCARIRDIIGEEKIGCKTCPRYRKEMKMRAEALLGADNLRITDLLTFIGVWATLSDSPSEVYRTLREHGHTVSRSSVYRALKRLRAIAGEFEPEAGEF